MTPYRVIARKVGKGRTLTFHLPAAMSRAIEGDSHEFEVSFTDDGIHLKYIAATESKAMNRKRTEPKPKWVKE